MIKRFRRSAAMAMIASSAFVANGAWAALNQTSTIATFADSLFGPGSTAITIDPDGASVITINTTTIIGDGNVADITYTVTNGAFAEIVSLGSISVTGAGVASFTKTDGGNVGDTSVTFEVAVTTDVPATENILFVVPSITNANLSSSSDVVSITATITPTTTAPNPFPTTIGNNCSTTPPNNNCTAVDTAPWYAAFDLGSGSADFPAGTGGGAGLVDIDDRGLILPNPPSTGVAAVDPDGTGPLPSVVALRLGTHNLNSGPAVLQRDGTTFLLTGINDGAGDVVLTASGNFRPGDIVFIDLANPGIVDANETFVIDGTTATYSVPVDTAEAAGLLQVFYVPNGTDALAPETFSLSAAIVYDLATNNTDAATAPSPFATTAFDGIQNFGYAYGVTRQGGTDVSFIRVTCEGSTECTTFFSCRDGAGDGSFGDGPIIPGNATDAIDSDELGALLGDVTFAGRAACDVFSDNRVSVQHKVRSSDILTDNSVVVGREIKEIP